MGKVYLIGAGPGAADLITVRGMELLKKADIVFYDALVQDEMLAYAPQAKKVLVGKRCRQLSTDQRFINRNLVEAALKYDVVVRLKGGDPMMFGRAQEEISALNEEGIDYEVVPGVTVALAASAEIGVSLTQRGVSRSVTFATPRVGEEEAASNWVQSVLNADTSVLYMGSGQAVEIAEILKKRGMPSDTPIVVIENVSLPNVHKIQTTLAELHNAATWNFTGPTVILLGKVFMPKSSLEESSQVVESPNQKLSVKN
jgi:uroporphyrin-III C-methyltransferase